VTTKAKGTPKKAGPVTTKAKGTPKKASTKAPAKKTTPKKAGGKTTKDKENYSEYYVDDSSSGRTWGGAKTTKAKGTPKKAGPVTTAAKGTPKKAGPVTTKAKGTPKKAGPVTTKAKGTPKKASTKAPAKKTTPKKAGGKTTKDKENYSEYYVDNSSSGKTWGGAKTTKAKGTPKKAGPATTKANPCSKKTDQAVRDICMKAVAQNIATLPLQNGVANLDRTISTKFYAPKQTISDVCGKGASYAIPASAGFDFSSSTTAADTTKTGMAEPTISFKCDAATDLYTLVMFDSMALPVKTRSGVPHIVRVNIGCTDKKMSDPKKLGVNLMGGYMAPANPMPVPFLYHFYLFKQSKRVVLKDNKLAGFNPMELQMMALPMDMTTGKQRTPNMYLDTVLLAKLKGYLVPGGPVARSWQRLVGSPVSAQFFKMMKYDMGQCADAVRNTWKYYLVTKMGPPALRLKSSHASIALGPEGDVKLARSKHGELTIKGDVGAPSLSVKDLKIGGVGIMEYIQKRVMERLQELKKQ